MSPDNIDADAKLIWDYHHLNQVLKPCDALLVLGSIDTRVAERAADLFAAGFGDIVIVSGGAGKLTKSTFAESEARIFSDVMTACGVPADKILLEEKSTNTGENIQFTYGMLQKRGLHVASLVVVQKPYMERRTYATFKKQWPQQDTEIFVTSPAIAYDDYFNETCPKELVLNLMVGDLQRIKEYARLGFQIEQAIPDDVWAAYDRLVAAGYDKHLIA